MSALYVCGNLVPYVPAARAMFLVLGSLLKKKPSIRVSKRHKAQSTAAHQQSTKYYPPYPNVSIYHLNASRIRRSPSASK